MFLKKINNFDLLASAVKKFVESVAKIDNSLSN
jgi:hypothetical protein